MLLTDLGKILVVCKMIISMLPRKLGVKMPKNTLFSVFSKNGGDMINLYMLSDFKKCEKQNSVEKFPVTEHRG